MNGEFLGKKTSYKVLLFTRKCGICFIDLSLFFVLSPDLCLFPGLCKILHNALNCIFLLASQHILCWNLFCYSRGLYVCNNQKLLFTQFPMVDEY